MIARRGGFTMIETMLVLAIGGLLTAGLMAGAGVTITKQRYRESVQGVQAFVQDGYNSTVVSENARTERWSCDESAGVAKAPAGELAGQSDCMLIGRYLTIYGNGTMKSQSVIAYQKKANPESSDTMSDVYNLFVADLNNQDSQVPWSSWITKPDKPDVRGSASVLIIRSPLTNGITTYTTDWVVPANRVGEVLPVPANEDSNFDMCVKTDALFAGRTQAVRIVPRSASANGVVIPDESEGICNE